LMEQTSIHKLEDFLNGLWTKTRQEVW